MASQDPSQVYPLYNTTFSLHRLSPLYTGSNEPLSNSRLRELARQFRDILAGEVLRGVRVGLGQEDDALARVGALQTVTWRLLPEEETWSAEDETELANDDTIISLAACRGMMVTVTYEKMAYKAILLRDERRDYTDASMVTVRKETDGFQHFPLLLSRMPGSLREAFANFLVETFDNRVSALQFSSKYLTDAFERYVADVSMGEDGEELDMIERSRVLRNTIKETLVVVGFDIPGASAALKTIDINIAREDLPRMVARGKTIGRQESSDSPFFDALATYIKGHLALDLRHEKVRIVRIACGAFVLGAEGKVKLTHLTGAVDEGSSRGAATRRLVNGFMGHAASGSLSAG
ncbi:kinetochore complex Sim4 subunit Fta1-domain-containing protein [Leptodontidium sp. 2 PMI_412]|nr:kinetochore complex Sim4 subunit Fta1-domain-containing protein [Leptodontidium sp. 2 PMI_412]